jgi:hypothetical protein
MPAEYTEVTLDDMERFLKRGFRFLRPKQGKSPKGEFFYHLFLSPNVVVRIWTSITQGAGVSRGAGQDAIRLQLLNLKNERERHSKVVSMKRTQGWRNTLQRRVEEAQEKYEDEERYWEMVSQVEEDEGARPPPPDGVQGPPPTDKQVAFAMKLVRSAPASFNWSQYGFREPPDEEGLMSLSRKSVSKLIDALKMSDDRETVPAATPAGSVATYHFLKRDRKWGLRGKNLREGDRVIVRKRDGTESVETVGRVVWQGNDGMTLAEKVETGGRRYASDGPEDESIEPAGEPLPTYGGPPNLYGSV